ncbi:MAG: Sjogren's syndrome/scleroderma autoantigen 1 family protein [Halobacteriales archaeon]
MSDTDDGSPDGDDGGFDKEAERERLREKYERDQERREATQQMSDLLLKGATMTNQHCEECGSPLFRMDGEVFCPSCGGTREEEPDAEPAAGSDESAATPGDDAGVGIDEEEGDERPAATGDPAEAGTPDAARPAQRPDESEWTTERQTAAERTDDPAGRREQAVAGRNEPESAGGADDASRRETGDGPSRERGATPTGRSRSDREEAGMPSRRPGPHEASVEEAPSMAQATASLRRAIVSLSEQAAQSDDPKRARDLLEAAGEAAEALSELQD